MRAAPPSPPDPPFQGGRTNARLCASAPLRLCERPRSDLRVLFIDSGRAEDTELAGRGFEGNLRFEAP